jgi:hypothetical protein
MSEEQKISAMMIGIASELLKTPESQEEMQAHLDLVRTAWNIAIKSDMVRKREIKAFIKKQKKYAPSKEALKGLGWEIRRVIKQKDKLYPDVNNRIITAEAVHEGGVGYVIRAYFAEKKEF